jgi:PBP1b-binding outer membrane lipoprotein LpoB
MANNFSNKMQNRSLIIFFNIIITMALAILVWVSMVNYVKHDADKTDFQTNSAPHINETTVNNIELIKQTIINNAPPQPKIFLDGHANIDSNAGLANPVASKL